MLLTYCLSYIAKDCTYIAILEFLSPVLLTILPFLLQCVTILYRYFAFKHIEFVLFVMHFDIRNYCVLAIIAHFQPYCRLQTTLWEDL